MDTEKLHLLRNSIQELFAAEESIEIVVVNKPLEDGELGTFIIKTPLCDNREGKRTVKEYMDRVSDFLLESGYEIQNEYSSSVSGSPIEGNISAFKLVKKSDTHEYPQNTREI